MLNGASEWGFKTFQSALQPHEHVPNSRVYVGNLAYSVTWQVGTDCKGCILTAVSAPSRLMTAGLTYAGLERPLQRRGGCGLCRCPDGRKDLMRGNVAHHCALGTAFFIILVILAQTR